MAKFVMPDIEPSALQEVLDDLARQPQFKVTKKTQQPNGLYTITVEEVTNAPAASGSAFNAQIDAIGVTGAILRAPSGDFRRPNGPLVMALQFALVKAGQAMFPDGDFGSITSKALRRWQQGQGLPQTDAIDADQWKRLTGLPAPSLFDLCLNVTADYEGTSFDRVVGNFDGAGITFGLVGFTLVNGELRRVLASIDALRPGIIASNFGALYPDLMSILSGSKPDQLAWADTISLGARKMEVSKPWKDAFQRVGQSPESRRAQIERAYGTYWAAAQGHIKHYQSQSPSIADLDAALWFDIAVQNSISKGENKNLEDAGSQKSGKDLREAVAEIIADGSSATWRKDVLARKQTFVGGTGDVHGSSYQLSNWGFTGGAVSAEQIASASSILQILATAPQATDSTVIAPDDEAGEASAMSGPFVVPMSATIDPASSPHASWPLYPKFVAFVTKLGLRHFIADELLFLGSQNVSGKCQGLNTYPAEELWQNIVPTVAVLDKLREELNAPIHFLSLYRSPSYNQCIDGSAANSFHMRYQAIDFVCDVGNPASWSAKLHDYRGQGVFAGGIGVYGSFVHVDTRGINRDWTG